MMRQTKKEDVNNYPTRVALPGPIGDNMAKIKVTVERIDGYCNLPVLVGDYFYLEDSKISVPEGKYICMWALQSMMPVFPILNEKDKLSKGHWIRNVRHFTCPDPKGKVIYRLEVMEDVKD
jgi:uncharacterized repeat protein (TIGR04076 family)